MYTHVNAYLNACVFKAGCSLFPHFCSHPALRIQTLQQGNTVAVSKGHTERGNWEKTASKSVIKGVRTRERLSGGGPKCSRVRPGDLQRSLMSDGKNDTVRHEGSMEP